MAMTLPITIPATPSSGSPPSDDTPNTQQQPRTPLSPSMHIPDQQQQQQQQQHQIANGANGAAQMKRKPSRRANTAERRATHNAVERQRRETLNGRFLDLAALLPNLSQIRRPSKSSIVNSSIAHIHASRRHRVLAARELRLVKLEADALRRELNEWRDRAGIPRIEEPIRGEGFSMVLSGELEVIAAIPGDDDDEDNVPGYGNYMDDGEDDYGPLPSAGPLQSPIPLGDDMDDPRMAMMKNGANPFAHSMPPAGPPSASAGGAMHLTHILPRPSGPMVTSPTFENPAMAAMYNSQSQYPNGQFAAPHHQGAHNHHSGQDQDKLAAWNAAHMYGQQQMLQAQRSLFTPPSTSHGLPNSTSNGSNGGAPGPSESPTNVGNPFADPASQAFFVNFQRQQQMLQQQQHINHGYASPDRDDTSSVGSSGGPTNGSGAGGAGGRVRERSGSLSAGSGSGGYGSPTSAGNGGGSPGHHAPGHGYEIAADGYVVGAGVPRRGSNGAGWGRDEMGMGVVGMSDGMVGGLVSPISAGGSGTGGGGNGGGFAAMM